MGCRLAESTAGVPVVAVVAGGADGPAGVTAPPHPVNPTRARNAVTDEAVTQWETCLVNGTAGQ